MIILGGLEDQIALLVWGKVSDGLFSIPVELANFPQYQEMFWWLLSPWNSTSPLLELLLSVTLSLAGANGVLLLSALFTLATFLSAYLLFRRLRFGVFLALVYTFSAYFWSHLGIHLSLMQLWIYPIAFLLIDKYLCERPSLKGSLVLGTFFGVSVLCSNYLGVFLIIFYVIYFVLFEVYTLATTRQFVKKRYLVFLSSLILMTVIVVPFIFSYLKLNFVQTDAQTVSNYKVVRPFEDFVYFSTRPWYFFIASPKNPVLGRFASQSLDTLKKSNYFLADDYIATEHVASYFGLSLLVLLAMVTILSVGKQLPFELRRKVSVLYGSVFTLFLFSLPPYFTLAGTKIWTPGYVIYLFLPMFRATSRLSVLMLLCLLVIIGLLITNLLKTATPKVANFLKMTVPVLLLFTLMETFIPPDLYRPEKPSAYVYLRDSTPHDTMFVVYPYSKSTDALFWLDIHRRQLMNLRGYRNSDYEAEDLTEDLILPEGIANASDLGADYLLVYEDISESELVYFMTNPLLELEQKVEEVYIFKTLEPND